MRRGSPTASRSIAHLFGPWRHRKGGVYVVLGRVRHSEDAGGERLVLYVGRSGVWVRPEGMFADGRFERPWTGLRTRAACAWRAGRAAVTTRAAKAVEGALRVILNLRG